MFIIVSSDFGFTVEYFGPFDSEAEAQDYATEGEFADYTIRPIELALKTTLSPFPTTG